MEGMVQGQQDEPGAFVEEFPVPAFGWRPASCTSGAFGPSAAPEDGTLGAEGHQCEPESFGRGVPFSGPDI